MVERYGWAEMPSPIGPLGIAVTTAGLARLSFGGAEGMADDLARRFPGAAVGLADEVAAVRRELEEYFAGGRRSFELPLDWRFSAGPQRDVLRALYEGVPFGDVVSYQELGARTQLGDTMPPHEVPRAVGGIMGSNPIPIVVPCHRVIASGGGLGGYGGGLETKRRLLALEGVLPLTFDDVLALGERS
jgi:methylated-DNA-[protein]-cysteine S-methyltransferase